MNVEKFMENPLTEYTRWTYKCVCPKNLKSRNVQWKSCYFNGWMQKGNGAKTITPGYNKTLILNLSNGKKEECRGGGGV